MVDTFPPVTVTLVVPTKNVTTWNKTSVLAVKIFFIRRVFLPALVALFTTFDMSFSKFSIGAPLLSPHSKLKLYRIWEKKVGHFQSSPPQSRDKTNHGWTNCTSFLRWINVMCTVLKNVTLARHHANISLVNFPIVLMNKCPKDSAIKSSSSAIYQQNS